MKLLIADKLPKSALVAFKKAGFSVTADPSLKDQALVDALNETSAQVLVVRSTKVPAAALEARSLSLVVRAGAGYNNVDTAAASRLGVYVANCPGKNAIAVAELTWGLIISLDRRIPDCVAALRAGRWNKKEFGKAEGLYGRTLGVVGLGEIGRQVVRRAKAFGMSVVAWSRSLKPHQAASMGIERVDSPIEVARRADVVSVHVALTDDTQGLVDAAFLKAMKPGAFFVNTSRGEVVDGAALKTAVESGHLRAGLDVWNQQPKDSVADFSDPLGALDGVVGTHHIGASTNQAQDAVAQEALRVARSYKETGEVPNCVNLSAPEPSDHSLVVRHLDRVGVLAHVLETLKRGQINVQEMQNVIFTGEGAAACATIRISAPPASALLEELSGHEHIIDIQLTA